MFHPIEGLSQQEARAANVRPFTGDGTPYLKVPGLKSVQSVRLGPTVLPPTITQKFPKDASLTDFETVVSPLYILQFQADGMPVLMRSMQSNDGMWQNGVPVFVQGEWEGDTPTADADPTTDGNKLTREQLLAVAAELGIDVPAKATKAEVIELIVAARASQ